jgi:hypothetical protein
MTRQAGPQQARSSTNMRSGDVQLVPIKGVEANRINAIACKPLITPTWVLGNALRLPLALAAAALAACISSGVSLSLTTQAEAATHRQCQARCRHVGHPRSRPYRACMATCQSFDAMPKTGPRDPYKRPRIGGR